MSAPFRLEAAGAGSSPSDGFPPALESYASIQGGSLWEILMGRIQAEPFNLVATAIFLLAITHTFMAPLFQRLAHRIEERHSKQFPTSHPAGPHEVSRRPAVSTAAEIMHFLGEIEAIFGIWVVPLLVSITWVKGWPSARDYLQHDVNYTEPMFVVVIMTMAASRPILKVAEQIMAMAARLGGGGAAAWWFSILTIGPILGSFITEPAAMTISALLLAQKMYESRPSPRLAYATLGLLFVNVSVGGTLTHFAAPPVLMVAGKWGWGMEHMFFNFGWKALIGIMAANLLYYFFFRSELTRLGPPQPPLDVEIVDSEPTHGAPVPVWLTAMHLLFLGWTIVNNHHPVLFVGGFLFYLAFTEATRHHQADLKLRSPLLVGFFLAGLVVHGGLQGWWIEPVLSRLDVVPLFFGALGLTAFNDNAAITYLATLVPNFSDALKYAVTAGAVVGGGLTVIANAPNPAGQTILKPYFPEGVSALRLLLGAAIPTALMSAAFLLL